MALQFFLVLFKKFILALVGGPTTPKGLGVASTPIQMGVANHPLNLFFNFFYCFNFELK